MRLDTKQGREVRFSSQLSQALRVRGNRNRTRFTITRILTRLGLNGIEQLHGVLRKFCTGMTAMQLPHQAGSVPRGAAGKLPLLQQDNISPTQLAEMIRHRTTQNAAANNHDSRVLGQYLRYRGGSCWILRRHNLIGKSGGARRDNSSGPSRRITIFSSCTIILPGA